MLDELVGSFIQEVFTTLLKYVFWPAVLFLCTPFIFVKSLISHVRYGGKLRSYLERDYFNASAFYKKWV